VLGAQLDIQFLFSGDRTMLLAVQGIILTPSLDITTMPTRGSITAPMLSAG
jgi:hypothetical protein